MRLAIIGLPGSGRSTVFQALTQSLIHRGSPKKAPIATVQVPDKRVEQLSSLFHPEKTVHAQLEYLLPLSTRTYRPDGGGDESDWSEVRPCDALIQVVRNFQLPGGEPSSPRKDITKIQTDLIFADLVVVERRIERLDLDKKRGKKINEEERSLLDACLETLESESPLRNHSELASAPVLRGYTFLSVKPILVLFNNGDEDPGLPPWEEPPVLIDPLAVRGRLELELSEMDEEDAGEFLAAYDIDRSAVERVIQHSRAILGLVTFFTTLNKEVRAWLVPQGTPAPDAAGVIHSDMQKGFIRAEVLNYGDLMETGSYQHAKKEGRVRLEGKDYLVNDGDIIQFHFNI